MYVSVWCMCLCVGPGTTHIYGQSRMWDIMLCHSLLYSFGVELAASKPERCSCLFSSLPPHKTLELQSIFTRLLEISTRFFRLKQQAITLTYWAFSPAFYPLDNAHRALNSMSSGGGQHFSYHKTALDWHLVSLPVSAICVPLNLNVAHTSACPLSWKGGWLLLELRGSPEFWFSTT